MCLALTTTIASNKWAIQKEKELGLFKGDIECISQDFEENPIEQFKQFLDETSLLAKTVSDAQSVAIVVTHMNSYDDLFAKLAIYHARKAKSIYVAHLYTTVHLENWQDENSAREYNNYQIEKLSAEKQAAIRAEIEEISVGGRSLLVNLGGHWQSLPDSSFDTTLISTLLENKKQTLEWIATQAKCEIEKRYRFELSYPWLLERLNYLTTTFTW